MKILVVGSNGFLGREISRKLCDDGNSVHGLNRTIDSNVQIEQYVGDLTRPESYREIISSLKPEIVIQSAWVTEQASYRKSALNEAYSRSTQEFAEYCFKAGTQHFIALGSCAEYGIPREPCNASSTRTNPIDEYGSSKLKTLEGLQELASRYSSKLSWGRIFQPYGPNQDLARFVPTATRKLAAGESLKVNTPHFVLDWISSRDVARAIAYTLSHDLPNVLDIGTSVGTSVHDVLKEIAELLHVDPELIVLDNNEAISKISQRLVVSKDSPLLADGWRPDDDLATGLRWALSL